jgi:Ca2+-binding RTX toxin-like protein
MWGRGGRDVLYGDGGNDWLEGGADRDWMTGGTGADQFVFAGVKDSAVGLLKRDVIEDFNHAEGDKINVANINAKAFNFFGDSAFNFIGEQEFSFAGQLRVTHEYGNTVIQANTHGTGGAEFEIELTGNHTLVASDFVL